jgi:carbonic anhydrase/acetyltransferase-like protein (isoleucine patch superfamily)
MPVLLPYRGIMPTIHPSAFIAPDAVIIGDVHIGPDTGIWYGCVLRGDVNIIRIGARTNIQDGSVIHVSKGGGGTHVGDDITVGHMALLHDCRLDNASFVGMKACIMDGAVVESYGMVAAGALVTPNKKIPSGELWSGNPAKLMRALKDGEREMILKSAAHYVKLAAEHKAAA